MFGNEAIAGYSAAIRFEQLFFLPLLGLNTAIISIVGQNFGAKNYKRIIEAYDKGLKVGIIILILLGIIIFIISEIAIKFFTDNNEVIKYEASHFRVSLKRKLGNGNIKFFYEFSVFKSRLTWLLLRYGLDKYVKVI